MELLPESFNPGVTCEQRIQLMDLNDNCISFYWNLQTEKAVISSEDRYLEFHNHAITVRQILSLIGFPVADVEIDYGPLNGENFLDTTVYEIPLSQGSLTYKTQTVESMTLLNMLHDYERGELNLYESIVMFADGILIDDNGASIPSSHKLLAEHRFPVHEQLDNHGCCLGLTIQTNQGNIYV